MVHSLFYFNLTCSLQSKENHGLLERLTNLASTHMNDLDTIQKLESELEKLAAQKRTYEEKGKKYKEDSEQVRFPYLGGACVLVQFLICWIYQMCDCECYQVNTLCRGQCSRRESICSCYKCETL